MTCEQFSLLIDQYLEGGLDGAQRLMVEEHLAACADCRLLHQTLTDCRSLDEGGAVPASFSTGWRQAIHLQEDEPVDNGNVNKPHRKTAPWLRWAALAASLVLVIGSTWLVGNNRNADQARNDQYSYEAAYQMEESKAAASAMRAPIMMEGAGADDTVAADMAEAQCSFAGQAEAVPSPQKIIRTVSMQLYTRDFEKDLAALQQALKIQGGYVELSDISGDPGTRRYASLVMRVPKGNLDAYLATVSAVGRVASISESQEDVSERYLDVEMRLKTQQGKMDRLQKLLEKAGTVPDILNIETEIANTQYQLDSLTGSLRGMDSKVDYATLTVSLVEETPDVSAGKQSLGQRIQHAMSDAWDTVVIFFESLAVLLSIVLPYLLALAMLVFLIRLVIKRRKNK